MAKGSHLQVSVKGVDRAIKEAGFKKKRMIQRLEKDVEVTTLEAINDARSNAPRLTGQLIRSIKEIKREREYLSRTYGAGVPYARRQEYEHKTKRGFMRKSAWNARRSLRKRVRKTIREVSGS